MNESKSEEGARQSKNLVRAAWMMHDAGVTIAVHVILGPAIVQTIGDLVVDVRVEVAIHRLVSIGFLIVEVRTLNRRAVGTFDPIAVGDARDRR